MKRFAFLIALLWSACVVSAQDFRKNAPAPGPAPKIEVGKYEKFTLNNGLTVIVVENHKLPRVSVQVFVDVDPIVEGDAAGYVTMAGDMLSRGTKSRTKTKFDQEVDFIGATFSSSSTGLFGASLKKHAPKLVELMADALLNPSFPAEEFEKLKNQQLSSLQSNKDDPDYIANQVGSVLNFGKKHPYGEVMTEESIEKASLDMSRQYYEQHFRPEAAYLILVGDITKAEAETWSNKYFGNWKNPNPRKRFNYEKTKLPEAGSVDFVNKQGAVQSVINVTFPVEYNVASPDYIAARVMNTTLGGYFRSRINNNLREAKGYTYGAGSQLNPDKLMGWFSTSGSYRNEVTDSALTQLLLEINKMRTEKVGAEELTMVKNVMSGNFARSLEEPQTVANFALNIARYGLSPDFYDTYLQRLAAVTADEVFAMAKKYLHPDKAHILVVGNKSAIVEKLRPFAKGGKINFFDLYGNPQEDIALAIPEGRTAESVIEDYIVAIGGDAARNVKTFSVTAEMKMGRMQMTLSQTKDDGKRAIMLNQMNGVTMQRQVYDGKEAYSVTQGVKSALEGEELEDFKTVSYVFPELHLDELGVELKLKGAEIINGSKAYEIEMIKPSGKTATYYYDAVTGLQVRAIEVQGDLKITTDYFDYRDTEGVKLPYKMTLTGIGPAPVDTIIKEYKINPPLTDDMFK